MLRIEVTAAEFRVREHAILRGVTFGAERGSSVALLGRSGVGKTTMLRLLAGLESPSAGRVELDGKKPEAFHAHREIGFLFQEPNLWPHLTVAKTLETTYHLHGLVADAERISKVLSDVGLAGAAARLPHQLSTGMRARLAVARIFCLPPKLLLMDEPFAAIDALRRPQLNAMVHRLRIDTGCTVVWTTHDVVEAIQFATKIVVLGGAPARVEAERAMDPGLRVEDPANLPIEALALRDDLLAMIQGRDSADV